MNFTLFVTALLTGLAFVGVVTILACSSDCSEVQLFLSQSKKKFDGVGICADLSFSCFL